MKNNIKVQNKFYISTSIAYANAKPHLGHALEAIQADVMARYRRQQGDKVFFVTGMDEHGLKIQKAAQNFAKDPVQLVDESTADFKNLYKKLNISYDYFIRTTEERHKKAAQKLWKACIKDIYKSSYTGLYCVECERFYTEKELIDNKCPNHQIIPEKVTEDNYFFKLSNYTDTLYKLIDSDELKIYPETRKNEILAILKDGLEDISISRSKAKLHWGIDVPDDESQVMYVWFDALSNYISAIGYGDDSASFDEFWPADLHMIGKDILRFHAALWPAMLLSAGLKPPKAIYVHGFITTSGQKMSKTLGNVIDPAEIIKAYEADALRYYLLREMSSGQDNDFNFFHFQKIYEADLANELGNLVQRVAAMIKQYQNSEIGQSLHSVHDATPYHDAMIELRFDKALEEVWLLIKGLNQYVDEEKPWAVAKQDPDQLNKILTHAAGDILQIANLLQPFLPNTADRIIQIYANKINLDIGILFPKDKNQKA